MKKMSKRLFLFSGLSTIFMTTIAGFQIVSRAANKINPIQRSEEEWRKRLTKEQFRVLRKEGTERSFTSPLNKEKRQGTYHCAGCELPLFDASTKYESGTGWPSFYQALPDAVATKTDYWIGYPRTEYHCARCGGHQGHIFKDGPKPTGLRYCNNGVALTFKPKENNS